MLPTIRQSWPVLVRDESQERAAAVEGALSEDARLVVRGWDEGHTRGVVGLVGWHRCDASPSQIAVVQNFRVSGAQVLCYAPGLGKTPLRACCEILLAGARDVLDCDVPDFLEQLRTAVGRLVEQEADRLAEASHLRVLMRESRVAGESELMFEVFRAVGRLSPFSDLPVLITGETGTGKELVAQAIHRQDPRRSSRPFIPLNCGALNADLAGSELFGHCRGAFTGATRDRMGLFRAAEGGVVFLDEIGELPAALQTSLLRVLQTSRVLGVGEDHEVAVNVRVIAATNRDLPQMVAEGAFRRDLFHRLNVTAIHIPPLRERPADIAPLVAHFLEMYQPLAGRHTVEASPDFLRALENAGLAGNARQVENLVRQALLLREHPGKIMLRDLPKELLRELAEQEPPTRKPPRSETGLDSDLTGVLDRNGWNLGRSLDHLEDLIVQTALDQANGNQAQAARRLGITPRSIYNKLHRRA